MAKLKEVFDETLRQGLGFRASWLPLASGHALGDYGIVEDGCFTKLGHISEYRVEIQEETGEPIRLNYVSQGAVKTHVAGGVEVPNLPDGEVAASTTFHFERAHGMVLKAEVVEVSRIANRAQVAAALSVAMAPPKRPWRQHFMVVHELFTARDALILVTHDAATRISLNGTASALKALELGAARAEIGVESDRALGIELQGRSGPFGLNLMRINVGVLPFTSPGMRMGASAADQPVPPGVRLDSWL